MCSPTRRGAELWMVPPCATVVSWGGSAVARLVPPDRASDTGGGVAAGGGALVGPALEFHGRPAGDRHGCREGRRAGRRGSSRTS